MKSTHAPRVRAIGLCAYSNIQSFYHSLHAYDTPFFTERVECPTPASATLFVDSVRLGSNVRIVTVFALWWAVRAEQFGKLPTDENLRNIQNFTASEVYTYDGILLGRYYVENRTNTTLDNINPAIAEALVATEDARFYEHDGVDRRSLARVLVKSILLGDGSCRRGQYHQSAVS